MLMNRINLVTIQLTPYRMTIILLYTGSGINNILFQCTSIRDCVEKKQNDSITQGIVGVLTAICEKIKVGRVALFAHVEECDQSAVSGCEKRSTLSCS